MAKKAPLPAEEWTGATRDRVHALLAAGELDQAIAIVRTFPALKQNDLKPLPAGLIAALQQHIDGDPQVAERIALLLVEPEASLRRLALLLLQKLESFPDGLLAKAKQVHLDRMTKLYDGASVSSSWTQGLLTKQGHDLEAAMTAKGGKLDLELLNGMDRTIVYKPSLTMMHDMLQMWPEEKREEVAREMVHTSHFPTGVEALIALVQRRLLTQPQGASLRRGGKRQKDSPDPTGPANPLEEGVLDLLMKDEPEPLLKYCEEQEAVSKLGQLSLSPYLLQAGTDALSRNPAWRNTWLKWAPRDALSGSLARQWLAHTGLTVPEQFDLLFAALSQFKMRSGYEIKSGPEQGSADNHFLEVLKCAQTTLTIENAKTFLSRLDLHFSESKYGMESGNLAIITACFLLRRFGLPQALEHAKRLTDLIGNRSNRTPSSNYVRTLQLKFAGQLPEKQERAYLGIQKAKPLNMAELKTHFYRTQDPHKFESDCRTREQLQAAALASLYGTSTPEEPIEEYHWWMRLVQEVEIAIIVNNGFELAYELYFKEVSEALRRRLDAMQAKELSTHNGYASLEFMYCLYLYLFDAPDSGLDANFDRLFTATAHGNKRPERTGPDDILKRPALELLNIHLSKAWWTEPLLKLMGMHRKSCDSPPHQIFDRIEQQHGVPALTRYAEELEAMEERRPGSMLFMMDTKWGLNGAILLYLEKRGLEGFKRICGFPGLNLTWHYLLQLYMEQDPDLPAYFFEQMRAKGRTLPEFGETIRLLVEHPATRPATLDLIAETAADADPEVVELTARHILAHPNELRAAGYIPAELLMRGMWLAKPQAARKVCARVQQLLEDDNCSPAEAFTQLEQAFTTEDPALWRSAAAIMTKLRKADQTLTLANPARVESLVALDATKFEKLFRPLLH